MRKLNKKSGVGLCLIAAFVLLECIAYRSWLFSFSILSKGDWSYFYKEAMSSLQFNYFGLWLSDYSFGRVLIDAGQAPTYAMYGFLAKFFGLGFTISERLIYLWPVLIVAPLATFVLLRDIVRSPWARLVGVCAYSFNTYIMLLQGGGLTLAGAWAFAPLVLCFFIKTLDDRQHKLRSTILTALFGAICSAYEPRIFFIVVWVLFFYACYYGLFQIYRAEDGKKKLRAAYTVALAAVRPVILMVLLDFFWIIGLATVKGEKGQGIIATGLWGSAYYNIKEALTLFHPFWLSPGYFIVQKIPFYAWLIPVFAFLGLYLNRKNTLAIFFGLLACFGILLTKQSDYPFPGLYIWLFHNAPGFNAFREASKFYGIIAISYSVLIALFVEKLFEYKERLSYRHINFAYIITAIACLIFIINLYPQAVHGQGNIIEARTVPNDYKIFKDFIQKDNSYSRIYWLPRFSRWSYYDALHPKVSDANNVFDLQSNLPGDIQNALHGTIFEKPYAESYFKDTSIKYVAIPLRDKANKDDFFFDQDRQSFIKQLDKVTWLHKLNIGTKELVVYENSDLANYFSAETNQTVIPDYNKLDKYYAFQESALKLDSFNTASKEDIPYGPKAPTIDTSDIFDDVQPNQIHANSIITNLQSDQRTQKSKLYANLSEANYYYTFKNSSIQVLKKIENPYYLNDHQLGQNSSSVLGNVPVDNGKAYSFSIGDKLYPMSLSDQHERNMGATNLDMRLYSESRNNLLPNGDFSKRLWAASVEDCNNYDSDPIINMSTDKSALMKGNPSLLLTTFRHIACTTSQTARVNPGKSYSLRFDYLIQGSQQAGYDLVFNDQKNTAIHKNIINDSGGHGQNYYTKFVVPDGATTVRVRLQAFPDVNSDKVSEVYYDNVQIHSINQELILTPPHTSQYTIFNLPESTSQLTVDSENLNLSNLVPNPSFEQGLWQQRVGDCNAYDDSSNLAMRLSSDASSGKQSLELDAKKHVACTDSAPIAVQENSHYLLSFDYQSDNTNRATYRLRFNDPARTAYGEDLKVKDKDWHNFSKTIVPPYDATSVIITVYSYSDESGSKLTLNRYDNFKLIQIPDIENRLFQVNAPLQHLLKPRSIDYSYTSKPTRKVLQVTGAKTGFFLKMSEAYQSDWRLEINNRKSSWLNSWLPLERPDTIPASQHFNVNDFQNGWYVDVDNLCKQKGLCDKNRDGTYDIKLVAEFAPQKWFNIGLIISTLTLLGCLGTLVVITKRDISHTAWKATKDGR